LASEGFFQLELLEEGKEWNGRNPAGGPARLTIWGHLKGRGLARRGLDRWGVFPPTSKIGITEALKKVLWKELS